jgi:hypothetical protein
MLDSNVLVLNRSYLPIHITSVRRAFSLIYRGTALAVNGRYETFDFEAWIRVDVERRRGVGTADGKIRVPRVICCRDTTACRAATSATAASTSSRATTTPVSTAATSRTARSSISTT